MYNIDNTDNKPRSLTEGFRNRSKIKPKYQTHHSVDNHHYNNNHNNYNKRHTPHFNGMDINIYEYDKLFEKYKHMEERNKKLKQDLQMVKDENFTLKRTNEDLVIKLESALKYSKQLDETIIDNRKSSKSNFVSLLQLKLLNRPPMDTLRKSKIFMNESCFNTELDKVIKHETMCLPKVLVECIKVLESKQEYMAMAGLYRVSGNHNVIQKLRYEIDANNYKNVKKQTDPHNITGLIKLFFRELSQPLITLVQLETALPNIEFFDMEHRYQVDVIRKLITSLPKINQNTLLYIVGHLHRVSLTQSNQMNAHSLSIVLGACIFYETMQDLNIGDNINRCLLPNKCLEIMIQSHEEI